MSIDLERSLDELARSVHDDALADRLNGQVYRMVAQVRRRRAARYTGTSVIGMSAAAAVVVGGMQLAGRDERMAPPATAVPDGAWPACGEPAPLPTPTSGALGVEAVVPEQVVPYGETVGLTLDVVDYRSEGDGAASGPAGTIELVVAQEGVVVATGSVPPYEDTMIPPDGGTGLSLTVELDACAGDTPLEGGDYAMYARVTLAPDGREPVSVITAAIPFSIAPNPLVADAAGLAAVDDIVSGAAERGDPFAVCGSVVQPPELSMLAIDLALDDRAYAPGESFTIPVTVRSTRAVPDGAQLSANDPQVVLTRDGVVVGRGGTADAVPIDLGPDGTGTLDLPGTVALCSLPGADAPETPLPAGTYQAYAAFTLTVHETELDGTQKAPWEPVVVRSEPVDVTIG